MYFAKFALIQVRYNYLYLDSIPKINCLVGVSLKKKKNYSGKLIYIKSLNIFLGY